jgi:putative ABC transport system ATP-binding protein
VLVNDTVEGTVLSDAVRSQKRDVVLGSLLVTVHQAAEVAVPVVIGVIIDRAVATGDGGAIVRWIAVLAGLFVVLSAAGCTAVYIEERAVTGATHRARLLVARRVLHAGGGVEDALPGEVVSLSTVETTRIGEGVGALILTVGALVGVLAGAAVLFATSLTLGLVVVIGLPIVLVAVQALSQPLVARADAQQAAVGSAAGIAADLFAGLRVLKGLGAEAAGVARYRAASTTALGAALDATKVRSAYLGITLGVAGGFLTLVTWVGGREALDGSISVGELVAALGITQFLVGPLGRLAFMTGIVAQARASSEHIAAALDAPPAVAGGTGTLGSAPVAGGLALRGLSHQGLSGLDLDVAPGELVGVVATDPADAAALVACLDRSVDPAGGAVEVDGVGVGGLALDEARRAVVVAHHDARLFEGSLGDNVAVALAGTGPAGGPSGGTAGPPGDEVDLATALEAAGADAVVDVVPGGLDAPVAEGGRALSGGQRQRVALARALAADPPVLVLHEPTTAVDAATEHRIATGVRSLRAGRRTTVLITASPTLLAVTDRVAVVHGGRVVAEGTHTELAAADDRYRTAVLT